MTIKNAKLTEEQKRVKKLHSKNLSQGIWEEVTHLLASSQSYPKVIGTNLNVLKMFIEKIKNSPN
jgi:hypothetical protein